MNLAKIIDNDIVDCDDGICVSVWWNNCPHRCKGCHNSQLFDAVNEVDVNEVSNNVNKLLIKNGVMRNLSLLGGEPMMPENVESCRIIVEKAIKSFPDLKIYLWTGYTLEELKERNNENVNFILDKVYTLIDGRFILEKRDITLKLRGSSNQRIFRKINGKLECQEK